MLLPPTRSGALASYTLKQLARMARWHIRGLEHWRQPALLLCWHGEILLGGAALAHLARAGECVAPLVREYGQSRAMTDFAHTLGLHPVVVPGYEQRAARREALLTLRAHTQQGRSLFMAADGHHAPARVFSEELLWLAPALDMPLLPLALAARPALTLPTWDRKSLPLPGSRIAVALAPPMDGACSAQEVCARLDEAADHVRQLLS